MSERTGERLGFFVFAFLLVAALLMYLERCAEEGPVPVTVTPPPTLIPSPGVTTTPVLYKIYLSAIYSGQPSGDKGVGLSGACAALGQLNLDWYYNWGSTPCVARDKRFVVMVWGRVRPASIPYLISMARATSGYFLGINEPDQPSQSDTTPQEGAEFQRQVESQAKDVKLVSPAPSQDNPQWLWQMVYEFERRYGHKPRFDAIAVHHYAFNGKWTDIRDRLISTRQQAVRHGYGDSEIWLTEWGGECWSPGNHNREIMRNLIPWMEAQPWMGRYFWFASHLPDPPATPDLEYCSLMKEGKRTALGDIYAEEF